MKRPHILFLAGGVAGLLGTIAFAHRSRHDSASRSVPGGIVMGDVSAYDRMSRLFFGSFFRGVASDLATAVPPPARVLEIGCGPGALSIELARRGFEVTGLDLDPAMIERARANAERARSNAERANAGEDGAEQAGSGGGPRFIVGDVAALPFGDASFDLVTSTLSMHHWADRDAGLAEIARVARPGGRVIVWDLNHGRLPFHAFRQAAADHDHDGPGHPPVHPGAPLGDGPLAGATTTRWPWPFGLHLADRFEAIRP